MTTPLDDYSSPEPIFDLLVNAKARPVSMWAMQMLRKHFPERLTKLTLDELLAWVISPNTVLNEFALEILETRGGLESVTVEQWLALMDNARTELLDRICEMVARNVKPESVSFADAVKLAMQRPVPLARLGFAPLPLPALLAFRSAGHGASGRGCLRRGAATHQPAGDRTDGRALVSTEFIKTNWASGYDERGQPIPNLAKRPQRDGALVRCLGVAVPDTSWWVVSSASWYSVALSAAAQAALSVK